MGSATAPISPNALCFSDELPSTGLPCHVEISANGLTVRFDEGHGLGELDLPFRVLSVSAGGLNHDQLVVRWGSAPSAQTVYLKDSSLIRTFRSSAPPELVNALDATAATVRRTRSRNRTAWGIAAATIGALMMGIWFSMDLLVGWAVDRIPLYWERRIGESAFQDFLIQHPAVKEGPAVAAVQEITERLIAHIPVNPYTFEIAVVESEVVNAFALPGGYVVVFTALLKEAENAEEVAGVLSHELNHVLERHALQRIVKQLGLVTVVGIIVGDQQGLARVMRQIGVELLSLKFGRSQETEADLTGLQLLHRSRIDPSGMVTFFQRLRKNERGGVEWLSTHPMSAGRAQRLEAEISRLPRTAAEPFTFKWNTVQDALRP
ncbi:MAG: putative Peptidase, family, partial [Nitrospira sp.]|nr:putative Peptidase, family [Nitrospira sp.]